MNLAIIKYNAGNIQSVLNALERLGYGATVTDDPAQIKAADKVIFPGVGEASSAMSSLKQNGLDEVIRELRQPVFGICVGMQLLCAHSEENDTPCLGIFPLHVRKFLSEGKEGGSLLKVPQMGWNTVEDLQSPLFAGVPEKSYIYNVHSFYAEDKEYTIARGHYGVPYAAAIRRENFYGVQFHTEKSAEVGDRILQNFIQLI